MRTRSGSRTATAEDAVEAEPRSAPSTEEPVSARPETQHEDSDSDNAPEEVTVASSRQAAVAQLREERLVAAQAAKSMRDRRRQRFGSGKGQGEEEHEEEAGGGAPGVGGMDGREDDDGSEEELDLLPSSVVSDLAQSRSDAVYREQSSVVSRHLRGDLDMEAGVRRKVSRRGDTARARRAGPVTVQVLPEAGLDGARMAANTASAASFLGSRLGPASKIKRSMEMLGGVRGRGPAVRPKIRI